MQIRDFNTSLKILLEDTDHGGYYIHPLEDIQPHKAKEILIALLKNEEHLFSYNHNTGKSINITDDISVFDNINVDIIIDNERDNSASTVLFVIREDGNKINALILNSEFYYDFQKGFTIIIDEDRKVTEDDLRKYSDSDTFSCFDYNDEEQEDREEYIEDNLGLFYFATINI